MNSDWVYGVTGALFIVWMQRHKRWGYMFQAMTGKIIINGTRGSQGGISGAINSALNLANPFSPTNAASQILGGTLP